MNAWRQLRASTVGRITTLAVLGLLLAAACLASLGAGPADLPVDRALAALLGSGSPLELDLVFELRAPRILLGALVGSGLAIVGSTLQSVLQNDLADPYILGISAGAGVGATISALTAGSMGTPSASSTTLFAFLSSLLSVLIVYRTAHRAGTLQSSRLLLAGVAFSSFATALSAFLLFFAPEASQVRGIFFWLLGGLGSASWPDLITVAVVGIPTSLALFALSRAQTLFWLGDEAAQSLGLSVTRAKAILIVLSALLTATTVAVAGAIGFVGLVVPHVLRPLFGPDQRFLLPASALGGALLLVVADAAARTLFAPEEIPVGVLTGLLGAPFFLVLLGRRGSGPL